MSAQEVITQSMLPGQLTLLQGLGPDFVEGADEGAWQMHDTLPTALDAVHLYTTKLPSGARDLPLAHTAFLITYLPPYQEFWRTVANRFYGGNLRQCAREAVIHELAHHRHDEVRKLFRGFDDVLVKEIASSLDISETRIWDYLNADKKRMRDTDPIHVQLKREYGDWFTFLAKPSASNKQPELELREWVAYALEIAFDRGVRGGIVGSIVRCIEQYYLTDLLIPPDD